MAMDRTVCRLPNPFAPESLEDPYTAYRQLLARPGCWHPELNLWLFTRYEDCVRILGDRRFSRNFTKLGGGQPGLLNAVASMHSRWILLMDPPEHTRIRSLIMRALSPRMEDAGLFIQAKVDSLLAQARLAGRMDVIEEFAAPLAMSTIAHIVGCEDIDRGLFLRWSLALAQSADPGVDLAVRETANAATLEMTRYLQGVIGQRRSQRRDDMISALITAREEGYPLSEDELLATCMLLLFGGYETSVHLIGNGVFALLEHPEQWERLRSAPSLIKPAMEEVLRFTPPLQRVSRMAHADVVWDGVTIRAGEWGAVVLGAANRDPARFPEPDRLDISRAGPQHIAFGHGLHYCSGASLARLEAQIAIGSLAREPGLRLIPGEERRQATSVFRGFSHLPVRLVDPHPRVLSPRRPG